MFFDGLLSACFFFSLPIASELLLGHSSASKTDVSCICFVKSRVFFAVWVIKIGLMPSTRAYFG